MKKHVLVSILIMMCLFAATPSTIVLAADELKVIRFGLIPSEDADKLVADSKQFISALEEIGRAHV
jgi:ABC-type phosphate/phosphonate transport system substrate-binding protein